MIRESEWNLREMMKSNEDDRIEESDQQIRRNIQQTYLFKL